MLNCLEPDTTQVIELFHYPSFDKHSSFLSKHYKSRVFSHTVLIDSITKFATLNQNIVYCNVYCIIGIFRNLAGNFEHISKTHSITEIRNLSKFVVLKHFGWNILHKESPTPFLFTICMLRSVFCKVISVE